MQIQTDWNKVNSAMQQSVRQAINQTKQEAAARAIMASNELRNAALNVLRGQRTGRVYRKPFTKKATYRASAPGEPPAVRTGALRMSWSLHATGSAGNNITAGISTNLPYAPILEEGSKKIAPRPYKDAIIERATPAIRNIFSRPYLK